MLITSSRNFCARIGVGDLIQANPVGCCPVDCETWYINCDGGAYWSQCLHCLVRLIDGLKYGKRCVARGIMF